MSLQTDNMWSIVWKQLIHKWKSNTSMLTGLAIFQVIGLFFAANGSGIISGVRFYLYTSDVLVIFTMIWLLVIGVRILHPLNSASTYTMVANRTVDHLSNIIWLLVMTLIAMVTVWLSTFLLQIIMHYLASGVHVSPDVDVTVAGYLIGLGGTFFYLVLASATGYFLGVLSQWSAGMRVFLPIILIGALLIAPLIMEDILIRMIGFIFLEEVFYMFVLKVTGVSALLFAGSISIGNRLEVRK